MYSNQSKIIRHAKKQEDVIHNQEEENQSLEMEPKMTAVMDLVGKDSKRAVTTMFKYLKENMSIDKK